MRRSIRTRRPTQAFKETNDKRLSKGKLAEAVQLDVRDIQPGVPPKGLPPNAGASGPHVPPAAIQPQVGDVRSVVAAHVGKVVKLVERKWFFEQGDGVWMRFWPDAEKAMNVAMDLGESTATLRTGLDRWWYDIDFKTMTQRNRDHNAHRVRKIKFSLPVVA